MLVSRKHADILHIANSKGFGFQATIQANVSYALSQFRLQHFLDTQPLSPCYWVTLQVHTLCKLNSAVLCVLQGISGALKKLANQSSSWHSYKGATAQIGFGAIYGAGKPWFWSMKIQIWSRLCEKASFWSTTSPIWSNLIQKMCKQFNAGIDML